MGRLFEAVANGKNPLNISGPVIARYAEDKSNKPQMLSLLKEWVADTSCATISYSERHVTIADTYSTKEYDRMTRLELDIKYKSAEYPEGKKIVDFLVKTSKSFAHPDYPKKKEMRQYRVLQHVLEGKKNTSRTMTDLNAHGQIAATEAASILLANHERKAALVGMFEDEAVEQVSGAEGANKKREKKVLTSEQQDAKDKADVKRANLAIVRKIQKEVEVWTIKIQNTKEKLVKLSKEALPEAGSGVQRQITVLEEFEPQLKNIDKEANVMKFEQRADEAEGCQSKLQDIIKTLKTELQVAYTRIQKMGGNDKVNTKKEPQSPDGDDEEAAEGGSQLG